LEKNRALSISILIHNTVNLPGLHFTEKVNGIK
jgi:hypothetical protein